MLSVSFAVLDVMQLVDGFMYVNDDVDVVVVVDLCVRIAEE